LAFATVAGDCARDGCVLSAPPLDAAPAGGRQLRELAEASPLDGARRRGASGGDTLG